jgi:hypothetical protein
VFVSVLVKSLFLGKIQSVFSAVSSFFLPASLQALPQLTKRALDGGDSAPFSSIFYASSFFCSPKLILARRPVTQTVSATW